MTTIDPNRNSNRGRTRGKKNAALHIDMTPMVDLGFLLISFFILTTQLSRPAITNLNMPTPGEDTFVAASTSITALLGEANKIFYYDGEEEKMVQSRRRYQTSYDELTGLGSIIRQKQHDLKKSGVSGSALTVLIKAGMNANYGNIVAVIDEMLINNVSKYTLLQIDSVENTFIR